MSETIAKEKRRKDDAKRDDPVDEHTQEELDEALDESFPASDPVAMTDPSLPRRPRNHPRKGEKDQRQKETDEK